MSGVSCALSPPLCAPHHAETRGRRGYSSGCSCIPPVPPLIAHGRTSHSSLDLRVNGASASTTTRQHPKFRVSCRSGFPSPPPPGERDSRNVLDAFFLGKAFAEALNERIGTSVGEVLSVIGRLQAEQQKQVQVFQDEVLDRAKKAKDKAAREALEAQGLIPKSATAVTSTAPDSSSPLATSPSPSTASSTPELNDHDPTQRISIDD